MPVNNINHAVITGNLTKDPELKETGTGKKVCELRVAVNSSFKRGDEWESKPNYFQVIVWGRQAENVNEYLSKGSPVAVDGRLEWQSWPDKEGDGINSRVVLVANNIQFLGGKNATSPKGDADGSAEGGNDDIPF